MGVVGQMIKAVTAGAALTLLLAACGDGGTAAVGSTVPETVSTAPASTAPASTAPASTSATVTSGSSTTGGVASASTVARPVPPTTAPSQTASSTAAQSTTTVGRTDAAAEWIAGPRADPSRSNDWRSAGPTSRPAIGWRVLDPIRGDPVAADGVVYASFDDATLRAIAVRTGETVWSREIGFGGTTPMVTSDAVYFVDGFDVVAVDRETGENELLRIGRPPGIAGNPFPGSPTIVGGTAYLSYSGLDDGVWSNSVVAYDIATATTTWAWAATSPRSLHPVIVVDGAVVLVAAQEVIVLDADLGIERWRTTLAGETSPNISLVADGAVVVKDSRLRVFELLDGTERWSSPDASLQHAASGELLLTQSLDVRAFHLPTGRVEWQTSWDGRILSDAISVGAGVVYVHGTQGGEIAAFDLATGADLWTRLHGDVLRPSTPFVPHDGVLLVVEADHQLVGLI